MPMNEGYYGSYAGKDSPGEEQFKPKGEPEKRDKRGSIDGSGVPPSAEGMPAEPDMPSSGEPIGGLTMEEVIRRATDQQVQPINKPVANADIVGGSAAAMSVEPGV